MGKHTAKERRIARLKFVEGKVESEVIFTYDEFVFADFDSWVRSRFGLGGLVGLRYYINDKVDGKVEVVPCCGILTQGLLINVSIAEKPTIPSTSATHALKFNIYLSILILLNAISFAPYAAGQSSTIVTGVIEAFFSAIHAESATRKLLIEAYIASLCWGTTYLFVRRIWNPENAPISQAIYKFAADAIFGGIAAGAAVIMKSLLVKVLSP